MKIYENFLPQPVFDVITEKVMNDTMPWYTSTTAYANDKEVDLFGHSFYHLAVNDSKVNSALGEFIQPIFMLSLLQENPKAKKPFRIRLGLITVTQKTVFHKPHVDFDYLHQTGLMYINDADGDTVFYKEHYDPECGLSSKEYLENIQDKLTVDTTITPKANTLVIFDGLQYHQSSTPTTVPKRITLNFNFIQE